MTIKDLSSKKLQIRIKKGDTPEMLFAEYSCTEAELRDRVNELYKNSSKAQQIYGRLLANKKQPHRPIKKVNKAASMDAEARNEQGENDIIAPETPAEPSLSDLKEKEKSMSEEVMVLESKHKDLVSKRRDVLKKLRDKQDELDAIIMSVEEHRSDAENIKAEGNNLVDEMNSICAIRRDKLVVLEKVRQDIEEKSRLTLFISADGVIEAPENPEFVLDDTGYQAIKAEIQDLDVCLDLTNRDTNTLARLLKMCEQVENLILVCDHAELEKAFWAIRQQ